MVLLLGLALTGCGGEDRTAHFNDCLVGFESSYDKAPEQSRRVIPHSAWTESGRRFCERAVDENLLEGGESDAEVQAKAGQLLKRHPEVLFPICISSALYGFDSLPAAQRTPRLHAAMESYGRRLCLAGVREGALAPGKVPTTEDVDDLIARNPEVAEPVCVVGGLQAFEQHPLEVQGEVVSRGHARKFLSRTCIAAAKRGLVKVSGALTPAMNRKIAAISARIERRMIAAGELP